MTRSHRRWVWLLCWLTAGILIAVVLRSAGVGELREALGDVRIPWLLMAVLCNLLILPLWGVTWRILLHRDDRIPPLRLFEVVSLASLSMNTVPFGLGYATTTATLAVHGRVGPAAALSVVTTHQVIEGIAKLIVLLLAASLAPIPTWMRAGTILVAVGAGVLGTLLFLLSRGHTALQGEPDGSATAGSWPRHALVAFAGKLDVLRGGQGFLRALTSLLGMKVAEGGAILCAQLALGVDLPLSSIPVVLGGIMLAGMVPIAPANVGTYETAAFLLYQQFGVAPGTALALAIVQHLALLVAFLGAGYATITLRLLLTGPQGSDGRAVRMLRALGFWLSYLGFSAVVGILALRRGLRRRGVGSKWKGLDASEEEIRARLGKP